jgi:DNA-binding transcriptional ArsR family regulator
MAYESAVLALGDPVRLDLFERLRHAPAPVGQLAAAYPISRPAISRHLKVLKEAGLVTDEALGTRRIYRVDPDGVRVLRRWLDQFWTEALENLKAEVERGQQEEGS